jgi:hypothetical protein
MFNFIVEVCVQFIMEVCSIQFGGIHSIHCGSRYVQFIVEVCSVHYGGMCTIQCEDMFNSLWRYVELMNVGFVYFITSVGCAQCIIIQF